MSTSNRIRWGGLAAMLGGLLYWVGWPGAAEVLPVVSHVAGHALFALGGLLSLLGLVGLLAHDAGRSARLDKIGLVIGLIGAALVFSANAAEAILEVHESFSWTSQTYTLGVLGTVIGLVLLGLSTSRGRVLPRWSALTLTLAPLSFLVIFSAGAASLLATGNTSQTAAQGNWLLTVLNYVLAMVYGAPWLALGYALWSDAVHTGQQPAG